MRKLVVIVFVVVFSFLYVLDILAFQFERYRWGETYIDVMEQVKVERKDLLPGTKDKIVYKDDLLGSACEVKLYFIPEILLLAYVEVVWNATENGVEIRDILVRKYGTPHQERDFLDNYIWFSDSSDQKVVLDYTSGEVKLTYYGGKYYSDYQNVVSSVDSADFDEI